jgi:hypothetical protein
MSISVFSRYASNVVMPIVENNISRPTIIVTTPSQTKISFSTYVWRLGDEIEYLAYVAYGDEQAWWLIANANPEILFWDNIMPGTKIRVPNA